MERVGDAEPFGGCTLLQRMAETCGEDYVDNYLQSLGGTAMTMMEAAHQNAGVTVTQEQLQDAAETHKLVLKADLEGLKISRPTTSSETPVLPKTPPVSKPSPAVLVQPKTVVVETAAAQTEAMMLAADANPVDTGSVVDTLRTELAPDIPTPVPESKDIPRAELPEAVLTPSMELPLAEIVRASELQQQEAARLADAMPPAVEAAPTRIEEPAVVVAETVHEANVEVAGFDETSEERAVVIETMILDDMAEHDPADLMEAAAVRTDEVSQMTEPADDWAKPRTVEQLLAMPTAEPLTSLSDTMPPDAEVHERAIEPTPVFSERLASVVAEVAEPERKAEIEILVAHMYELAESLVAELVTEASLIELTADAEGIFPEPAAELERAVERLLRSLAQDGAQPEPEQVRRVVQLVCEEVQMERSEAEAVWRLGEGIELPSEVVWAMRSLSNWLEQLLGRLALLQPTSVS